jgi:putative transposase
MRKIDELHLHPFMGARMLHDQLTRQGFHLGRRHIRTRMQRMCIAALAPQPDTCKATPGHKSYRYPLRKMAITLGIVHAKEVIEQAFARDGTSEVVNTDQGFTVIEFTDTVLARGCKLSIDGRGFKYERVYLKVYDDVSAARADIAEYLGWYNTQRPHSSLERLTPHEKYVAALPQLKLAA